VTDGDDSDSRVISLRLDEARAIADRQGAAAGLDRDPLDGRPAADGVADDAASTLAEVG
jgi:hypothetical protein